LISPPTGQFGMSATYAADSAAYVLISPPTGQFGMDTTAPVHNHKLF